MCSPHARGFPTAPHAENNTNVFTGRKKPPSRGVLLRKKYSEEGICLNTVDYVLLGIVGISLLFGMYRGFITSLLGLASVFGSMFAAYALGPKLSTAICGNQTLVNTLIHYTDASSRLGDLELSRLSVAGISMDKISEIVARVNLPEPFGTLLKDNILSQVFSSAGSTTISEYINQTIVTAIISVISYVLVFLAAYVALSLVTGLIGYIFRLPALRQLDALVGGLFGVVRGVFIVFVFFALVPVVMTILPFDNFSEMVETSKIGSALYHSNIIPTILEGHL